MENVAAYCYMARREYDESLLEFDGTLARERAMAGHIGSHLQRIEEKGGGHVLVVTGGFHTAHLPKLFSDQRVRVDRSGSPACGGILFNPLQFRPVGRFERVYRRDAIARYYDLIWTRLNEERQDPYTETATDLLVEIGRLTRKNNYRSRSRRPTKLPRWNTPFSWPSCADITARSVRIFSTRFVPVM